VAAQSLAALAVALGRVVASIVDDLPRGRFRLGLGSVSYRLGVVGPLVQAVGQPAQQPVPVLPPRYHPGATRQPLPFGRGAVAVGRRRWRQPRQ
jgi:hypothetical protein